MHCNGAVVCLSTKNISKSPFGQFIFKLLLRLRYVLRIKLFFVYFSFLRITLKYQQQPQHNKQKGNK